MDSLNDDGAVVELRQKYHPGDGDGGWPSRSASRMGAVRRQGMSLMLSTRRHAMYDDQIHHDPSGHRATSDGRMHPEAPGGATLITSNGGADNSDDDNDDDEFLEFSSDDDEIYANTVSYDYCFIRTVIKQNGLHTRTVPNLFSCKIFKNSDDLNIK